MGYQKTEGAKWGQAAHKVTAKLETVVDKALTDNAARGFSAPTGATLETILQASREAQGILLEENAKIYDDQRKVIFEQEEFYIKIIVQVAKLAMEEYRERIINVLAIEQAEAEAERDRGRADVERMNAETDLRQASIIHGRAEMEQQITGFKSALNRAEAESLTYEKALVRAQLQTAEKKLEIIASIYEILAAEKLVLVAENQRAAALERVLAAKQMVAEIKQEMIPFYKEKAEASLLLASAIEKDTVAREQIENLGFDRLRLKVAQEDLEHRERLLTEELEVARQAVVRADSTIQIARANRHRLLLEYQNLILMGETTDDSMNGEDQTRQLGILHEKHILDTMKTVDETMHTVVSGAIRKRFESDYYKKQKESLTKEIANILSNITGQANSKAETVKASATTSTESNIISTITRRILKG